MQFCMQELVFAPTRSCDGDFQLHANVCGGIAGLTTRRRNAEGAGNTLKRTPGPMRGAQTQTSTASPMLPLLALFASAGASLKLRRGVADGDGRRDFPGRCAGASLNHDKLNVTSAQLTAFSRSLCRGLIEACSPEYLTLQRRQSWCAGAARKRSRNQGHKCRGLKSKPGSRTFSISLAKVEAR
jgi:hypothetical protein